VLLSSIYRVSKLICKIQRFLNLVYFHTDSQQRSFAHKIWLIYTTATIQLWKNNNNKKNKLVIDEREKAQECSHVDLKGVILFSTKSHICTDMNSFTMML